MPRKWSGVEESKNENNTSFEVYINEGEMYQINQWVFKHKNIETGGDLFGLWLDDHTAVVQFVLGPGKNCRRTTTSFFQDVQYLQEAGSYLTDKHGLCNIGQWHSHHRINLPKPSHGDENTVWGNMPVLGLNRYIVFIANITHKVTVNCFLFHYKDRKRLLTKGQFKYLHGNSPLRLNGMVLQNTFDGLESFINPAMFEMEMKFLRDNDAIEAGIETTTGDNCGPHAKKVYVCHIRTVSQTTVIKAVDTNATAIPLRDTNTREDFTGNKDNKNYLDNFGTREHSKTKELRNHKTQSSQKVSVKVLIKPHATIKKYS